MRKPTKTVKEDASLVTTTGPIKGASIEALAAQYRWSIYRTSEAVRYARRHKMMALHRTPDGNSYWAPVNTDGRTVAEVATVVPTYAPFVKLGPSCVFDLAEKLG